MDGSRFGTLTRILGDSASRREAFRVAMGGSLATALATLGLGDAGARKKGKGKKKCKKPKVKCKKKCCKAGQVCAGGKCTTPPPAEECQFGKTATLWTLQGNCTISQTIEIPDGVTLDGNNKTITMSGNVSGYLKEVPDDWTVAAAVLANGGNANVHDLTIRGSGLSGSCDPTWPEGLAFINTSGQIRNVTVRDIVLHEGLARCGSGITMTGTGGQTVSIEDVTVNDCPSQSVWALTRANTPGITVDLDGATITHDSPSGVGDITYEGGRIAGTIANASLSNTGISIFGRGDMTGQVVDIVDVTMTNATGDNIVIGMSSSGMPNSGTFTVNVTGAEITSTGDPESESQAGIVYRFGDGAEVSGTVDDTVVRGGFIGILLEGDSQISVQNTTVEDSTISMVNGGGSLVADGNTLTGGANGVYSAAIFGVPADSTVINNTIEGGPASSFPSLGVGFADGASGSVSGNTISNFFDTDPSGTSCGIAVFENAGEVTIGTNTFPDPPGNEEDICLDIPVPSELLHAGRKGNDALGIAALRQVRGRKESLKSNGHAGRDRKHSRQKDRRGRAEKGRAGKH